MNAKSTPLHIRICRRPGKTAASGKKVCTAQPRHNGSPIKIISPQAHQSLLNDFTGVGQSKRLHATCSPVNRRQTVIDRICHLCNCENPCSRRAGLSIGPAVQKLACQRTWIAGTSRFAAKRLLFLWLQGLVLLEIFWQANACLLVLKVLPFIWYALSRPHAHLKSINLAEISNTGPYDILSAGVSLLLLPTGHQDDRLRRANTSYQAQYSEADSLK